MQTIAFHFATLAAPHPALQSAEKTCWSPLPCLQGTGWFLFLVPLTFLKNKYFHLFCCQAVSAPCSNQQGCGQWRLDLCDAERRLLLGGAEKLSKVLGLRETLLLPDTHLFPTRNETQGR